MPISVEVIEDPNELPSLRHDWNELATATPKAQFFQTFDWFDVYWRHHGHDQRLHLMLVRRGDAVIGIVPLVIREEQRQIGKLRVLTFPLDDWGSFYQPLTREPITVLQECIDALGKRRKRWDVLSWRWLDPERDSTLAIEHSMQDTRMRSFPGERGVTGIIDCPTSWDEYLQQRGGKFRNNLRRWQRRVEELGTLRYEKWRPNASDADPVRWDLYRKCETLASQSWQGSSVTGTTLSHESVCEFLRDVHVAAAKSGAVDLNLMYLNEQPVAFEYGYWWNGYKDSLRFGYNGDVCRKGLGNLMWLETIRASIEAGDHTFDMGPGSLDYKRFFMSRSVELKTIDYFRTTAPRAQAIAWKHRLSAWYSSANQTVHTCLTRG